MNMDIDKIRKRLLRKYPFFGVITANTEIIRSENVGTAETDGSKVYYNPLYLEQLDSDEQLFVLAHEICHIAFNHILRSEDKDSNAWNDATDAVINAYLKKDGLKMPEGAIDIDEAVNYSAEELYDKMLKDKKNSPNNNSSGNKKGSPDNHDLWKNAVKKSKQTDRVHPDEVRKKIEEISKENEKSVFDKNGVERKKNSESLRKAIVKEAIGAGKTTESKQRVVGEIGNASQLIDWRYLLNEAIYTKLDWTYRNAEIEDGVLRPFLEEISQARTEIVLDTSSSVNSTLLKNFLRECKSILQSSQLKVGCFDVQFYGFTEIRNEKDIDNMVFQGGGGTNFNAAVNAFSRQVENKIIFTDGDASMPDKRMDAIWIVYGDRKIKPNGGKVIYINNEQLKKLCFADNNKYDVGRKR